MTTGSKRVVLGFAATLAAIHAGLGALFIVTAIDARNGYFWWAAIIFVGGLAAVVGLIIIPQRPKIGGALAYLGALSGVTMWVSFVFFSMTFVILPAILGVTIIYDHMKASPVAKLVLWVLSVLLLGVCFLGLIIVTAFVRPVEAGFWILGVVILQIPVVVLILASVSSQNPASIIVRVRG